MANPFAPPQVNIAGGINNLLQTYQAAQDRAKAQTLDAARKTALQNLMSGQEKDPAAFVMGYLQKTGDFEGANKLASAFKSVQPPGLNPYQQWQVTHGDEMARNAQLSTWLQSIPSGMKEYWINNPDKAPPMFTQAIGVGGSNIVSQAPQMAGDQGMPPPGVGAQTAGPEMPLSAPPVPGAMAPIQQDPRGALYPEPVAQRMQPPMTPNLAAPAPTEGQKPVRAVEPDPNWKPKDYAEWSMIKSGKMATPSAAAKHANLVVTNLEQTKNTIKSLIENPNLENAVGGLGTMLEAPPSGPGFYRGVGGVASSVDEHGKIVTPWWLGGTKIADVHKAINSLKDQISLAIIQNMKEASKTGSTNLGRVMQIEYSGWQNALGSLDPHQRPETLKANLQNMLKLITNSEQNIVQAFHDDYGGTSNVGGGEQADPLGIR